MAMAVAGPIELKDSLLYEGIATFRTEGAPYATPLGFRPLSQREILMELYKGSVTSELLPRAGKAVINVIREPRVYAATALKDICASTYEVVYEENEKWSMPVIKGAEAYILVKLSAIEDIGNKLLLRFEIQDTERGNGPIIPYSRCHTALIESIIYATKVRALRGSGTSEEQRAINNFRHSIELAKRLCEVADYEDLISKLEAVVNA